jgi:hypothetical protein
MEKSNMKKTITILIAVIGIILFARFGYTETVVVETYMKSIMMADLMYGMQTRYFNAEKKPLKAGESGPYSIECELGTNQWNDSGNPNNLIWDGDVPRFKNDAEKCLDLLPSLHRQIDSRTDALMYDTDFDYTYDGTTHTFNTAGKNTYFQDFLTLDSGDYPHLVKAQGPNYFIFLTQADHRAFIRYGANLIRNIVKFGRCLKYGGTYEGVEYTGIYNMTYQQLKDFEDPRSQNE